MNEKIAQAVRELQAAKAEEAQVQAAAQESQTRADAAYDALVVARGNTMEARRRLLSIAEGA